MANNFQAWWGFCQRPENDGHALDSTTDGAGETRYGWTYPAWMAARAHCGQHDVSLQAFEEMTPEQACALAEAYHWQRFMGPRLPSGCDISLIDFAWTSGQAIREIQQFLFFRPASADNIMGPNTLAAIRCYGAAKFIHKCYDARVTYYTSLGFVGRFDGLFNRSAAVRDLSLSLLEGV